MPCAPTTHAGRGGWHPPWVRDRAYQWGGWGDALGSRGGVLPPASAGWGRKDRAPTLRTHSVNPNPGAIAWQGAGWAGIICVVLAGWTTANPTLYRAGLAFQVVTPNWRRWAVTMFAGLLMVITACIPFVIANLDYIVAYYGLFFMPLGAFIFIDFWVFPKLGLTRYYAERKGLLWSWPATVGWFGSFFICFLLFAKDQYDWMEWSKVLMPKLIADTQFDIFILALPAWVMAITFYLICSIIQQKISPMENTE